MNRKWLSTLIHLRFPFSVFLMPIFFAALALSHSDLTRIVSVFLIFHLLIYPASNGFNSYFDRDEGPIGGIASPPEVNKSLLAAALVLDGAALLWAFFISPMFGWAVLLYGTSSKLYSWDKIRIKRLPIAGWLLIGFGQGAITFLVMVAVLNRTSPFSQPHLVYAASVFVTSFLLGIYPITQVYQHKEDARHGDMTISRLVGIRGTFAVAGAFLALAVAGFFYLLNKIGGMTWALIFLVSQIPAAVYFIRWFIQVRADEAKADYGRTMAMSAISSGGVILYFAAFLLLSS